MRNVWSEWSVKSQSLCLLGKILSFCQISQGSLLRSFLTIFTSGVQLNDKNKYTADPQIRNAFAKSYIKMLSGNFTMKHARGTSATIWQPYRTTSCILQTKKKIHFVIEKNINQFYILNPSRMCSLYVSLQP